MASLSAPQLIALVQSLTATIQSMQHRLDWFEHNLFGTKSERLRVLDNDQQLSLGEVLSPPEQEPPVKERQVEGYTRRAAQHDAAAEDTESVPFFDESCVPVETIELRAPELEGLEAGAFEIIGQKVTHRAWHLPLYRQHQRLEDAGIRVNRPRLTQLVQRVTGLLEPIYDAQFASIRESRVKAMDETPIKAGRSERGKMRTAYFWPVYGELPP